MKFISKVKAFFNFKGQESEMEVNAAEIRNDKIFLHPITDPHHVFCMKFKEIGIHINPNEDINDSEIIVIDKENIEKENSIQEFKPKEVVEKDVEIKPLALQKFMPKKKRFTIMVYQDEYDMLMENIISRGYKKAEYFLACVSASKKQSWEKEYKNITTSHKQRYKNDKYIAQQAVAEQLKKDLTVNREEKD